jgi:hypothetical protein
MGRGYFDFAAVFAGRCLSTLPQAAERRFDLLRRLPLNSVPERSRRRIPAPGAKTGNRS